MEYLLNIIAGVEILALIAFSWFALGFLASAIFIVRTLKVVKDLNIIHICVSFVLFVFGPITFLYVIAGLSSDIIDLIRGKKLEDWI